MNTQGFINQVVKAYLNDIASRLTNQPEQQRAELLKQLESHIYEALDAQCAGREATLGDLDGVLKEMDSPESYGKAVISYAAPAPGALADLTKRDVLFGRIAIGLCVLGWAIMILHMGRIVDRNTAIFVLTMQIVAIMLGVVSWKTRLGKMAVVGAGAAALLFA